MSKSAQSPPADRSRFVAIVGLYGRFPGASNLDQYWRNLVAGRESLAILSDDELRAAGVEQELIGDPAYVKAARVLSGVDEFDAEFFDYSPAEAEIMDPQHRLFLEGAWSALENAGYTGGDPDLSIAVYAGLGLNTYLLNQVIPARGARGITDDLTMMLASDKDFLATRVSFQLDLTGPSLVVQSGCSSSLVAVALAFQALTSGECDLALAGGVSIRVPQRTGYRHLPGGIVSPDGHCRPFDAGARGTSFGSGLGIAVLKRLDEAIADRDPIRAVLRGAAINNDGAQKIGYTAPSVERQAEVIATAQAIADVEPSTISFVEAHGTGTELGDPVEVAALAEAFGGSGELGGVCALGSVKSHIGHLDAASGIAGLIKTVLALEHGRIPPTLHFDEPNPALALEATPFFVNAEPIDWHAEGGPRRAGVSSFGIGGTNAHVVLEEAPQVGPTAGAGEEGRATCVLPLSARTPAALDRQTVELATHLRASPGAVLADVAYTLQLGRRHLEHRRVFTCRSVEEAIARLDRPNPPAVQTQRQDEIHRPVAFLLPGQGSQHAEMGRELYETEGVFRRCVDEGSEQLEDHLEVDLRELLYPAEGASADAGGELRRTSMAQPAMFLVEYALAQTWIGWGVEPAALLGHSVGELVAACLAGVFGWSDALALVARRGQLIDGLPGGAMLAVPLAEEDVAARLPADLAIAAINTPRLCTVSGPPEAVARFEAELAADGHSARRVEVSHAFHSTVMDPIVATFAEVVDAVPRQAPTIPIVSSVTGDWITDDEATDSRYWARQIRRTVRFSDALETLLEEPARVVLEVGPGTALSTFAAGRAGEDQAVVTSMRHPRVRSSDVSALQRAVGELWLHAVPIDWARLHAAAPRRRVALPTYPFERARHWIEPAGPMPAAAVPTLPADGGGDPAPRLYLPSWTRAATRPGALAAPARQGVRWLILGDRSGPAEALAERLRSDGHEVLLVRPGERFERLEDGTLAIAPASREDYDRLRDELGSTSGPIRVAHLWLATGRVLDRETTLARGFLSLHHLAEALTAGGGSDVRIDVVASGTEDVVGDPVRPERATVHGAARVIPQERPRVRIRTIDIDVDIDLVEEESTSADWGELLIGELHAPHGEPVVAYRGGYRWVPSYPPAPSVSAGGSQLPLREGGAYWITGGLGGIGMTLAEHLAETLGARLLLTGRSELPPRREWGEQIARSTPLAAKLARVRALEASGAELLFAAVDVTDRAAMRAIVEQARAQFGSIDGVIHAAGVPGAGPSESGPATEALEAKVTGTLVLADVLGDEPDFIVLCSALSAVLGGLGQSAYCAGNAFLDAFARSRHGKRPRVVSIGWETWSEVGMAVDAEVPRALLARQREILAEGITSAEGIEIFRRVLAAGEPHVLVSTRPIAERLATARSRSPFSPEALGEPAAAAVAGPEARTPSGEAAEGASGVASTVGTGRATSATAAGGESAVAAVVGRYWSQLLGVESAAPEASFFELGGNSLLALQLLARMQERYPKAGITLKEFFEGPTIGEMVRAIEATRSEPETVPEDDSLRSRWLAAAGDDRRRMIRGYLIERIAAAVEMQPAEVAQSGGFESLDPVRLAAQLTADIRHDVELPLYPPEIRQRPTIDGLAEFVDGELVRMSRLDRLACERTTEAIDVETPYSTESPIDPDAPVPTRKNDSIALLLSAPRSGSTLFRLMLSAHSRLFCPPELFLLDHERMQSWTEDPFYEFYREGLVRGLMGARDLEFDPARARVDELIRRDAPVYEAYALLQSPSARLVDKTPTYALSMSSLDRAERLFKEPLYIALVRHPFAMIDSFVRNRLDRVRRVDGDPYAIAESCWLQTYRNVDRFRARIGPERLHVVRFEELVAESRRVLGAVCDFLGVTFEEAVLDPYRHGEMLGGPGDPYLFGRGVVDPALGDAWRAISLPRPLGKDATRLAHGFDYEL